MRNGIIFLIVGILYSSCGQKQEYQITGTFNGPVEEEWIYLGKFMENELKPDSARIENGQFEFKGTVSFPEVYGLSFHPNTSPQIAPLFLEASNLEIIIDLQNWYSGSIISGGKVNSELQEFNRIQDEKVTNKIILLEGEKQLADDTEKQEIDLKIAELFELSNQITMDYIKNNPDSPISIFLLAFHFFGLETAELGEILKSFSPQVKQTTIYNEIIDFYDNQIALEQKTPAFNYSDHLEEIDIEFVSGEIFPTLVNLNKGKPIYIKIWGSWCAPCKKEFPHIRELRKKIDNENFVFAYFCVLSPEEDWRMLIQEEELKGQHFLLSKDLSELLLAELEDKTVPKYILIDKDGSVVDMNAPKPSDYRILVLLNEMIK